MEVNGQTHHYVLIETGIRICPWEYLQSSGKTPTEPNMTSFLLGIEGLDKSHYVNSEY